MGVIIALIPLVNLSKNAINTVYAESINNLVVKNEISKLDKKVYYEGSIEDDFADDTVIIVLNEEETHKFKTYTPKDFSEINCVSVTDLTGHTVDYVEEQIKNKKNGKITKNKKLVNVDNFRRILSLELGEKSKENVLKAIKKLEKRDEIISAEPDGIYTICSIPSDSSYINQWGLDKINATAAWDITTGSSTVTVGVMDSGIDASHSDLDDNISTAGLHRDFTSGSTVIVQNPTDPYGHGTHVAGIIGAEGNNSLGVCGVAWDVSLVSLRVFDENGYTSMSYLIPAVIFAANQNIPILNYSGRSLDDQNFYYAIAAYDGLFITSAGNENNNIDEDSMYPAAFDLPNIISVGASDSNDNRSDFATGILGWLLPNAQSSYGVRSVDIFAPGSGILSTIPSNYGIKSGTSMAAPFVTGVTALIMSIKPNMDPIDIKNCILYSSDTIASLNRCCLTSGRLNAYEAVKLAQEDNNWWEQPVWTSNSSSDGSITASSNYTDREPYGAYDGWLGGVSEGIAAGYPASQWTANATSGWLELNLDDYIKVSKIYFYNRQSGASEYTKRAYFTGMNNIPLGEPFYGKSRDYGLSIIEVNDVITNKIKLNVLSSYGSNYMGASEIIIVATSADKLESAWEQPIWTSNSNSDGTITASGTYSSEYPWKAYNYTMNGGSGGDGDQWSVNATSGWLELRLNYNIKVDNIAFYNGVSTASNRTKLANFTGCNGQLLGESGFTAPNRDFGHVYIDVGGVVTNVVRLNVYSSYGSYINASAIVITGTVLEWQQPVFTSNSNVEGTVTASGYHTTYEPYYSFDGYVGGSPNNPSSPINQWTELATSGWLKLELNDYVEVEQLYFYNGFSGQVKDAKFLGTNNVSLGDQFVAFNQPSSLVVIDVDNVLTNIIYLDVISSHGSSYISSSEIVIVANKHIDMVNTLEHSYLTQADSTIEGNVMYTAVLDTGYEITSCIIKDADDNVVTTFYNINAIELADESYTFEITEALIDYSIMLDNTEGTGGTDSITANYGQSMPTATAPTKTGYTFGGYYTDINGAGTQYYDSNMNSVQDWDQTADDTLYAKWTPNTYTVTFNMQGGTGGTNSTTVTYDASVPVIIMPTRIGYTFDGYSIDVNGTGLYYYDRFDPIRNWDQAADDVLYAIWTANSYTVTLDKESGSGGSSSVIATYDGFMPSATAPIKIGHTFGGYYTGLNGTGTQYYDGNMNSVQDWNQAADDILYANWIPNTYAVTLNNTEGVDGTASITASYGLSMPTATAPTRTGYAFGGYYTEMNGTGTQYYDSNMNSVQNWDQTAGDTLYAYWTIENYTINFSEEGGNEVTNITEDYGTAISLPTATRTGYTFGGWWSGTNGTGTEYTWTSMPDLGSDGEIVAVYAKWTANTYTVTLNQQSGTGGTSSVTATYDSAMPTASAPSRTGYTFGGYYTGTNGGGTQYYTSTMASTRNWDQTEDDTLYAKWTVRTYTVTLNNTDGTGGTTTVTVTYNEAMPSTTAPTRTGYDFVGYYTGIDGTGIKYYASDMTSYRDWDQTSNDILYAYWLPSGVIVGW